MDEVINIKKEKRKKHRFKEKIKKIYDIAFSSNKNAIISLISMISFIMLIYFLYIYFVRDNFYNNWSDDSLQYYPFMCDFIDSIKSGTFSLYSFKNYLGSSFFSDTYYIPLDVFTLLILILSFFMNTEVAMSVVEIVKMIVGVWAISKFLSIKGYKPKTVFLIGLFYFSSSGITCFSCFPCFTSLAFYLPFSLIVVNEFVKGKWYYTPIYSMLLVFYNFYLAYTVFAFMAFTCLFMLIIEKRKLKNLIIDLVSFVLYVVLGLIMAMVIFLPSIKFVLSSTSRNVASGGSLKGLVYILYGYLDIFITIIVSFLKLFINLLKEKTGIFNNIMIFDNSFIQVRYLFNVLKSERIYNGVSVMNSFFEEYEYYRMLSTTFTPLYASCFYGYQSSYFIEHISFYITGIGLLLSMYLWFMKDYKSKVYKSLIILTVVMMLLPFFSYIISANLEVLYTRWFNCLMVPLLLIDAHVINENKGIFNLKPKKVIIALIILIYMGVLAAYNHLETLTYFGNKSDWDIQVLSFENKLFYFVLLIFFLILGLLVILYFVSRIKNKPLRVILKSVSPVIIGGLVVLVLYIIVKNFVSIPEDLFDTNDVSGELFSVDDQMTFQYLIFVTLVLMSLGAYSIIKKHKIMFVIIVLLEFVFSACMSFGQNVIYSGKETTFENTHNMSDFVSEYIDEDDLFRIYVDSSCGDYLDTNTARLMPKGTNQDIFHSFINADTDGVAGIIFDKEDEGQAGKEALNTYSYYLNVLLGYKYVLSSSNSSFKNYDKNQFSLVAIDEELDLMLLEFKDYSPFLTYDSYIDENLFEENKSSLKALTIEKTMTESVIVDSEYLCYLEKYGLTEIDSSEIEESTEQKSFTQKKYIESTNEEVVEINGIKYNRYEFSGADEITTRSYAINIFNLDDEKESLVENNQIFIEFKNGDKYYLTNENIKSMQGSSFHIPIYGDSDDSKIMYLYIYLKDQDSSIPTRLRYTAEAIFAESEYFTEYENFEEIPNDAYLDAAIRINVNTTFENGILNFSLGKYSSSSTYLNYNEIYIEYEEGDIVPLSKELAVSDEVYIKNIYIIKSNDILELSSPPSLIITKYICESSYDDNIIDKHVSIDNSKITISYINNNTDGYSLIMIPYAYSDEFEIVKGEVVQILPVNGGFIGIIIDNGIRNNTIILKFVPDGIIDGLSYSIIGILVYVVMLINSILYIKKKKELKCQL